MLRSISAVLFILVVVVIASCKRNDDDPPAPEETAQERAQALLEGTWNIENGSIELDGSDVSNAYEGFILVMGNGTLSTTSAGALFPATGTWSWVGETDNQIETGRGKAIMINTLTATSLIFSFTKTSTNGAAGVSGAYRITLNK